MNWQDLLAALKEHGYTSDDNDLAAIKAYIKEHFDGNVMFGDKHVDVDAVYAAEYPAKDILDLTAASINNQAAAQAALIAEQAKAIAEAAIKHLGIDKATGTGEDKAHDIQVGKNLLVDHPTGGYEGASPIHAIGLMLQDIKAVGSGQPISEKLDAYQKAALSTYANENIGPDGGYAVPPEMRTNIEVRVTGEDSLLSRADQIPMTTQSITLPDDETTPWGSSGIQATWEGEATAIDQSKSVLKQKRWTTRKLAALVPITDELAEDAPAMGAYLNRKVGEVLDFKVGEALIRGTGAGQPLGVLEADGTISVAKETSQVANTFIGINALKMMSRIYPPYRGSAIWLANPDMDPYLFRLGIPGLDAIGSDSTTWGTSLFLPASGVSGSLPTLMGRPIIYSQHCAPLGDVGDIILGSWQMGYGAAIRGGLNAQSSMHFWFDQSVTAFRFVMRIDGQPYLSGAIAPRAGSNTMSAFVTCATR